MKNLLEKEDHTALVAAIAIGAITAAGIAYLYLTEGGHETRKSIKHKLKDEVKDLISDVISGKTGISKKTVKKAADHVAE